MKKMAAPTSHIRPFRFDMRTLLACVAVSAVTFALLEAEDDAREAALSVGAFLYPILNYGFQFWQNLNEPDAN
jgi:hypothetical protein